VEFCVGAVWAVLFGCVWGGWGLCGGVGVFGGGGGGNMCLYEEGGNV